MARGMPKYVSLVNWIREQVIGGELKYGEKFYSENELSSMFDISRQTVRQAVGLLEQEGLVERRHGSGTYVVYGGASRRSPTMNIGVVSTYIDSYIFPSIIRGIDSVLSQNGYSMQLSLTNNQVENETRVLRNMLDKDVDGLIVEPTKSGLPNPNRPLYDEIREKEIPLIFFNAYYPNMDFPHVCMDDTVAGRLATQCLLDAGHRRIAGIFQSDDRQGHLRYAGYISALKAAGIEVQAEDILWYATEDIQYLAEDYHRIRRVVSGCTGVVCYNDQIAFIVVTEARKHGITVPDDLSVVGIDDSELASICEVPLTSVPHPMDKLGETAAEHILRLIKDPNFSATVDFIPELVQRASVRQL